MNTVTWKELLHSQNKYHTNKTLLALDPGHTVGFAYFEKANLVKAGAKKIVTPYKHDIDFKGIRDLIELYSPKIIVMEEYRIYQNKAQIHIDSNIPTLRVIGAIEMLAAMHNMKVYFQSASRGKSFITDIKLQSWNMLTNSLHTNDAIRHGCTFLLFDKSENGRK
jgi:hypothetical protein